MSGSEPPPKTQRRRLQRFSVEAEDYLRTASVDDVHVVEATLDALNAGYPMGGDHSQVEGLTTVPMLTRGGRIFVTLMANGEGLVWRPFADYRWAYEVVYIGDVLTL